MMVVGSRVLHVATGLHGTVVAYSTVMDEYEVRWDDRAAAAEVFLEGKRWTAEEIESGHLAPA